MKRIIPVLLIIVLMFSIVIPVSADDAKFNVKITSSASKVKPGAEFEVTFLVTDITEDSGLISLEMEIEYDASKVNVVNKTNIFPSAWGNSAADFSPTFNTDDNKKQTGKWEQKLLYDGDDYENASIPVFKDDVLGVKVTFKALDNASGTAKISLTSELMATGNDLDIVMGKSSPITVEISSGEPTQTTEKTAVTTTAAKSTTAAPVTSATEKKTTASAKPDTTITPVTDGPTASATVTGDTSVTASVGDTTAVSTDATASETTSPSSMTESQAETTGEATEITTGSQSASAAGTSNTPATTSAEKKDGGSSTLVVIAIIVAVVLAASAFFAIKKFKKTEDDDNPVNPG